MDDHKTSSTETPVSLPFYPMYESEVICHEKLRITWFEVDFCQSRYNFDFFATGSNACTIIAVLMAARCHKDNVAMCAPHRGPSDSLIRAMALSMLEGNRIYNSVKGTLQNLNLTIPEAVKLAGDKAKRIKEWRSMVYAQVLSKTLFTNLMNYINEWKNNPRSKRHPNLYVLLVADSRSSLFVFNESMESITLVDTHQHTATKGACLGVVNVENTRCLCTWLAHIIYKYYHSVPNLYELSFMYFKKNNIAL